MCKLDGDDAFNVSMLDGPKIVDVKGRERLITESAFIIFCSVAKELKSLAIANLQCHNLDDQLTRSLISEPTYDYRGVRIEIEVDFFADTCCNFIKSLAMVATFSKDQEKLLNLLHKIGIICSETRLKLELDKQLSKNALLISSCHNLSWSSVGRIIICMVVTTPLDRLQ